MLESTCTGYIKFQVCRLMITSHLLQVPQFILDDIIESELGGYCNIVCTQPRRIAVRLQCNLSLVREQHHRISSGIMWNFCLAHLWKSLTRPYIELGRIFLNVIVRTCFKLRACLFGLELSRFWPKSCFSGFWLLGFGVGFCNKYLACQHLKTRITALSF
jgi:hypothetical protein